MGNTSAAEKIDWKEIGWAALDPAEWSRLFDLAGEADESDILDDLPDDPGDPGETGQTVATFVIKKPFSSSSRKSINEVVREYRDRFSRLLYDGFRGRASAGEISRSLRRILKNVAGRVYREGMREAGSRDVKADFDDSDAAAIENWLESQSPYLSGIARAAADVYEKGSTPESRAPVLARMEMWIDSLDRLGGLGRAAMMGNPMLEFGGPSGLESCLTCQRLMGKRMRKKTILARGLNVYKGNENYICGGWLCQHAWSDAVGNRVL